MEPEDYSTTLLGRQLDLFISNILQDDLRLAYQTREKLKQELIELDELKHTIELAKSSTDIQKNGLETSFNIGCDFFVDAVVPDLTKILLNLGADTFIECTLDEALRFIANKQRLLEHEIEYMTYKIAQVEGHITLSHLTTMNVSPALGAPLAHVETTPVPPNSDLRTVPKPKTCVYQTVQSSLLSTMKSTP